MRWNEKLGNKIDGNVTVLSDGYQDHALCKPLKEAGLGRRELLKNSVSTCQPKSLRKFMPRTSSGLEQWHFKCCSDDVDRRWNGL